MQLITKPENLSLQPDEDTKKGLPDFTGNSASERVLHISLYFFKYGTNDKTHAAAIMLSLFLLLIIVAVICAGMFMNDMSWPDKVFNWLGSAFLFVSGVALGSKGDNKSKSIQNDED